MTEFINPMSYVEDNMSAITKLTNVWGWKMTK